MLTIANILAATVTVPTLRMITEQLQNKEPKKQGDLAQWSQRNLQIISQIYKQQQDYSPIFPVYGRTPRVPEGHWTSAIVADLQQVCAVLGEVHYDSVFLVSHWGGVFYAWHLWPGG